MDFFFVFGIVALLQNEDSRARTILFFTSLPVKHLPQRLVVPYLHTFNSIVWLLEGIQCMEPERILSNNNQRDCEHEVNKNDVPGHYSDTSGRELDIKSRNLPLRREPGVRYVSHLPCDPGHSFHFWGPCYWAYRVLS